MFSRENIINLPNLLYKSILPINTTDSKGVIKMSESSQNGRYFNSSNDNDIWLKAVLSDINEHTILEEDCHDYARQAIRDVYYYSETLKFADIINNSVGFLHISTTDGKQYAYKPKINTGNGLVVDNDEDGLYLIRGTLYSDSLDHYNDKYAVKMLYKSFIKSTKPEETLESKSLTVPIIAAKGQLGTYGYMINSKVYDESEFNSIFNSYGGDDKRIVNVYNIDNKENSEVYTISNGEILVKVNYSNGSSSIPLYYSDLINIVPSTIQNISLYAE